MYDEDSSMEISLPTDSEGYLTQECKKCYRKFKVKYTHDSSTTSKKELTYCPYCGEIGKNGFFTRQQTEFIENSAMSKVVGPMMEKFGREIETHSGEFLKFEVSTSYPKYAISPIESEDLKKIYYVCCDETIKILENWDNSLFCIICGKEVKYGG